MPDDVSNFHPARLLYSRKSKDRIIMGGRKQGVIVISTFANEKSARRLAAKVLESKLCACVNITRIQSMYSWKGKISDHREYLALFKTTSGAAGGLKKAIAKLHPYEVPEIVELGMTDLSEGYLSWLISETSVNSISKKRHNPAK